MTTESLIEALEQTPAPPCDGCDHSRRCALKTLACRDFFLYVTEPLDAGGLPRARTSIIRDPTREMYDVVFGDDSFAHTRMSRGGPLKPEIVAGIKASTETQAATARKYGVAKATVHRIWKGAIYNGSLLESSQTI